MAETIVIASDHGGYELKEKLITELQKLKYDVDDLGTYSKHKSVDYPDYAHQLADIISNGLIKRGILICGTGIGMSMTANRHAGIRASLCHDITTTRLTRQHNDANILVLGARVIGEEVAKDCLRVFLETSFEGDRHINRLNKMDLSNA